MKNYYDGDLEAKEYYKTEFYESLDKLKEFKETRESEQWDAETNYFYKYARSGW